MFTTMQMSSNPIERYSGIPCDISFMDLTKQYQEVSKLQNYELGYVLIESMWVFYPKQYYQYLKQIREINKFDFVRLHQLLYVGMGINMAIDEKFQIFVPESEIHKHNNKLSNTYMELIDNLRVYNSIFSNRIHQSRREVDEIASVLLDEARTLLTKLNPKNLKADNLGELFWKEGLLKATWKYLGLNRWKYRRLDFRIKRRIADLGTSEDLDQDTRNEIQWNYNEEAFGWFHSLEHTSIMTLDAIVGGIAKYVKRMLRMGKSRSEKKLEKLLAPTPSNPFIK